METKRLMKTATVLLMSLLILTSLCTADEVKVEKQIKYACILFDQKGQVAFEGVLNPKQFQKWFKVSCGFGGYRLEPPKESTIFGSLVLTDGGEILAMPLYTWTNGKLEYYCCQLYEVGAPPRFLVMAKTRQGFLEEMKKQLSGHFPGE